MGAAAADKALGPAQAPARAPRARGKRVRQPRLLPPGATVLPGASAGERGGEVLYSPAAFVPAEAQRLLERLQARLATPGHVLCTLGSSSLLLFNRRDCRAGAEVSSAAGRCGALVSVLCQAGHPARLLRSWALAR